MIFKLFVALVLFLDLSFFAGMAIAAVNKGLALSIVGLHVMALALLFHRA